MNDLVKDENVLTEESCKLPVWGRISPRNGRAWDVEMQEIIKRRRSELGLSQAELARMAGVDTRQIRRYEAGETHPNLPVAVKIAKALGITIDELAGENTHRINVTGDWWASWQTSKDSQEIVTAQEVHMEQRSDLVKVASTTRGIAVEDGGYMWNGELRLWDNEILMGWYVADEGAVRSKGTMYMVVHPHGVSMKGRWVGISYDGKIVTGWGAMGKSEEEARRLIEELKAEEAQHG